MNSPLRVAAIDFLNPAPLMWDFTHPPRAAILRERYRVHTTTPALCAAELLAGEADLGLIPIAALADPLVVISNCAIASLHEVRSILLLVRQARPEEARAPTLARVRTLAADTASRSSVAYAQVLFRHFLGTDPTLIPAPADPLAMLAQADAALLIGDPALLAREHQAAIEAAVGPCLWIDLAAEWRARTGLPWVAAVWAARRDALGTHPASQIADDLQTSRTHGLRNIPALVEEWSPRIAIPPPTIHHYLSRNIHYTLDAPCLAALQRFRHLAAAVGTLPPLPEATLELLGPVPALSIP